MLHSEVRHFTGPNMRAVLADVRAAFGREALILSQEQAHGRVRVTASGASHAGSGSGHATPSLVEAAQAQLHAAPYPALNTAELLAPLGFDDAFLKRLPVHVRDAADAAKRVVSVIERMEQLPRSGVFRLIGPPGSGKTSLVVNWAAEHLRRHPDVPLRLVSTDTARLGGTLMLDRAGSLLGVPVHHAQAEALEAAVGNSAGLVLIDTRSDAYLPGRATRDVCVLSASAVDQRAARAWVERASAMILTHVQPGRQIGVPLSVAAMGELPVLALGTSADVPGGIADCSGEKLHQLLLDRIEES